MDNTDLIARLRARKQRLPPEESYGVGEPVPDADALAAATALETEQAELAEARAQRGEVLAINARLQELTEKAQDMAERQLELTNEARAERDRLAALLDEAVDGLRMIANRKNNSTWDACNHARTILGKLEGKG